MGKPGDLLEELQYLLLRQLELAQQLGALQKRIEELAEAVAANQLPEATGQGADGPTRLQ